jgi:hypothetical protein
VTNPYPNLGFNPAPGAAADLHTLRTTLNTTARTLEATNDVLARLRDDTADVWRGKAGEAFRAHVDTTLATDLLHAQRSVRSALDLIRDWSRQHGEFTAAAARLDHDMAAAKQAHAAARERLRDAESNPDLGLIGRPVPEDQLAAVQRRVDDAQRAVRAATADTDATQDAIDAIAKRARELEAECLHEAARIASELKDAAARVAPHEPGFWDRLFSDLQNTAKGLGSWIEKHQKAIHDACATVSAATGFLALVTPPPADAAFEAVSLMSGMGSFATDALDPKVRQAFSDVLSGHVSLHDVAAFKTVGLDAAGAIPGVVTLSKAGAALAGEHGLAAAADIMSAAAKNPGLVVKSLDKVIPNSALHSAGLIGKHTSDDYRLNTLTRIWRGSKIATHGFSLGEDIVNDR